YPGGPRRPDTTRLARPADSNAVSAHSCLYTGVVLRSALAAGSGAFDRSVLADAGRLSIISRFALPLCETDVRYHPFRNVVGYLRPADGSDRGSDLLDQWSAGHFQATPGRAGRRH